MTDKLYNGFNNGRDKSDGIGGREVNHGTNDMAKEFLTSKGLLTHGKSMFVISGDFGTVTLNELLEEYSIQEVAKEREKYDKLHNEFEFVCRQVQINKDRCERYEEAYNKEFEKAKKIEHALKMCVEALKVLDATDYVAYTAGKVALVEYNNQ